MFDNARPSLALTGALPSSPARLTPTQPGGAPGEWRSPSSWTIRSYELRTLVGLAYGVDASQIVFADKALATRRYDFALSFARCQPEEMLHEQLRAALKQELHLSASRNVAAKEVFVLTAPASAGSHLNAHLRQTRGGETSFSTTYSSAEEDEAGDEDSPYQTRIAPAKKTAATLLTSISITGGTLNDLCDLLSKGLNRPVLNETGLQGKFDVELEGVPLTRQELFTYVWNRLGLQIAVEKRDMSVLTVLSR